jgi:hypothetical protein
LASSGGGVAQRYLFFPHGISFRGKAEGNKPQGIGKLSKGREPEKYALREEELCLQHRTQSLALSVCSPICPQILRIF